MRYISEEDLRAHLITDNCDDGCGYLDERDIPSLPWIELDEDEKERVGHWITKDGKEQGYDIGGVKTWYIQIICSECGFIKTAIEGYTGQYKYCPNCGARMVDEQERSKE